MSFSHRDYTVACICPMGVEMAPVQAMLDQAHPILPTERGQNSYILGELAGHNIVIAVLPEIGTNSAATVATQLLNDFPSIRFGLLVGIGGGIPDQDNDIDIRLGDVVVSKPTNTFGGVVQYDMGKETQNGFERTGTLNKPPFVLRSAVQQLVAQHELEDSRIPQYFSRMLEMFPKMKEKYSYPGAQQDHFFTSSYEHQGGFTCSGCDEKEVVERRRRPDIGPYIHYGTIGSANRVVKNAAERDKLKQGNLDIICVEMEAAGLMDSFPCLVIRGICDYTDSHKNKQWQPYAAAAAAGYMKELLSVIPPQDVVKEGYAADVVPNYARGLSLVGAPEMGDGLFIGREAELKKMEVILLSNSYSLTRKVLILGGMGGIGKTQLAITYAKRHHTSYSSVFWLNATSESALIISLRRLAPQILPSKPVDHLDEHQLWTQISLWLSSLENTRWLLLFDNYDDPDQYQIEQYYPYVAHGSIIITTRQPDRVNGCKIKVQSMANDRESLNILATRSGRTGVLSGNDSSFLTVWKADDGSTDPGARQLARRLDGFPLALATAGAFLKQSSVSFSKYLQQYEAKWQVTLGPAHELPDYRTRTLYTTWNLSLVQIEQQLPHAAKLLGFLAYLDHQDIWYDLFQVGPDTDQPQWFADLTRDEFLFEQAMIELARYCLVEGHYRTGSYSLHVCVHDWTLDGLNRNIDSNQYWLAFDCVASHVHLEDWDNLSALRYRRLTPHAVRLAHERFRRAGGQQEWLQNKLTIARLIGELLKQQVKYKAAERMYLRVLGSYEQALGPDHLSTLDTVNSLGNLYADQGKRAEAEGMYERALAGYEQGLGPDHPSTLDTVNNLGLLYHDQGKMNEAEKMFQRASMGRKGTGI